MLSMLIMRVLNLIIVKMTFRSIEAFFDKIIREGYSYALYSAYDCDEVSIDTFSNMKINEVFTIDNHLQVEKVNKDWVIILDIKENKYSFIFLQKRKWILKGRNITTNRYTIFIAN